jgi:hypothetical protein
MGANGEPSRWRDSQLDSPSASMHRPCQPHQRMGSDDVESQWPKREQRLDSRLYNPRRNKAQVKHVQKTGAEDFLIDKDLVGLKIFVGSPP